MLKYESSDKVISCGDEVILEMPKMLVRSIVKFDDTILITSLFVSMSTIKLSDMFTTDK